MGKFFYRVGAGEKIADVANRFGAATFTIIRDNELAEEPSEGDILFVNRGGDVYEVSPRDTSSSVAEKFGTTADELRRKNANLPYLFYGIKINV